MAIAVRGSNIAYVNNVATINFAFPAGSVAGDLCVISAGHGFAVNLPTDWVLIDSSTGSNTNGSSFYKALNAADITAGTVTITFTGTYYGTVAAITFVGSSGFGIRTSIVSRNTAGAATRTVTTDSTPVAGDYAFYFGHGRGNTVITSNKGALLQTQSGLNASGALYGGILAGSGVESAIFSFSVTPTSDYDTIIVVRDGITPEDRVASVAAEVLMDGAPVAQIAQVAISVLRTLTVAPPAVFVRRRPAHISP